MMMTVFKVLMLLCSLLSFIGSIGDKDENARKLYLVLFAVAGTLFMLAEAAGKFLQERISIMKALTVKQPWAELIFREMVLPFRTFKKVETRSWKTNFCGRLAIHAAKKHDEGLLELLDDEDRMIFASAGICCEQDIEDMVHGAIIGEVTVVGCVPIEQLRKTNYCCVYEETFGDWSDGRYGWIFADPVRYDKPIPAVGKLGLWEWEGSPHG